MSMNVERMTHFLNNVLLPAQEEKRQFNIRFWLNHPKVEKGPPPENHWCGTTCCGMGLAALDPEFIKQGLHIRLRDWTQHTPAIEIQSIEQFSAIAHDPTINTRGIGAINLSVSVDFEIWSDIDAAVHFFEIARSIARWLFLPSSYDQEEQEDIKYLIDRVQWLLHLNRIGQDTNHFFDMPNYEYKTWQEKIRKDSTSPLHQMR